MKTRPIENSTWSRCGLRVHRPVQRALEQRAEQRGADEGERQAGEEGHAGAVHQQHRDVAAGHREGAVREVDEVHQPQRHRQADGEHEQQHAVGDAVEEQGQHDAPGFSVIGVIATRLSERRSRARAGRGASLRRSPLRGDSPAVLGLGACGITRYVRCAHCAQTDAASQMWKRAARAAPSPALLGAAEAHRNLPGPAFARRSGVSLQEHSVGATGGSRPGRCGGRRAAQGRGRRARSARFHF